MYDTLGNPTYISEHYKPEFTITPVTSIDTSVFALSFIVDHHYSRFFQPGTPFGSLNFVDSVYMIRNYSNGDSVINLPIIIPDNNPPYI